MQARFVDVVQGDVGIGQLRMAEDVAQQRFSKHSTAGAEKGDFWHLVRFLARLWPRTISGRIVIARVPCNMAL